jgi:pimeloyl-ACP methyl ester carboxylesterase
MSVVTLDDEIIHYEVLGRGRPLFFLHGWVGSWRYWVPTMQAASIQYRAYALDLWGYGDTAKCPANYILEAQAKLLNDFIETLGIARIGLIGHGLGAIVGLAFAQKFPQLVNRLCLSGLPLGAYSLNPRLRSASIIELIEWLLGKIPNTEAAKTDAPKADNQAIFTALDDLPNFNALEVARQLETPCLLIYGQDDLAVQVPASKIIDTLPGQSHTIIFDQSGHFPMLEEPSKFNRLLSDFFALENGESPRKLQLKEEWKRRIR